MSSLLLSPVGECLWGRHMALRGASSCLFDPHFNPGLVSTITVSDEPDPSSPCHSLLKARYGPFILYMHASHDPESSSQAPPCSWSLSPDLTFACTYTKDRIAITSAVSTYTQPHSDAGDGWCGVCGVTANRATGSLDHWYVRTGLHVTPDTHTGPLTAATTIQALVQATVYASNDSSSQVHGDGDQDAWLAAVIEGKPYCSQHNTNTHTALLASLSSLMDRVPSAATVISAIWLPLHWGGYAYHAVLLITLKSGYILAVCPLSLRIIQIQHPMAQPVVNSDGGGGVVQYTVADDEDITALSSSLQGIGYGVDEGGLLVICLKGHVCTYNLSDVVRDLRKRVLDPCSSGTSLWPCADLLTPSSTTISAVIPLASSHIPLSSPTLSADLFSSRPTQFVPPQHTSNEAAFQPLPAALPMLPPSMLCMGSKPPIGVYDLHTQQQRKGLTRQVAGALLSMAKQWWWGSNTTTTTVTYYSSGASICKLDEDIAWNDNRSIISISLHPHVHIVATSSGPWPYHALTLLTLTHTHASTARVLSQGVNKHSDPVLPVPPIPWSRTLATGPESNTQPAWSQVPLCVTTDDLNRVSLIETNSGTVLHMWRGYRQPVCAWVWPLQLTSPHYTHVQHKSVVDTTPPPRPLLAIYVASRQLLEVYSVGSVVTRVGAINTGNAVMVVVNGQGYTPNEHIYNSQRHAQDNRGHPVQVQSEKVSENPLSQGIDVDEEDVFVDLEDENTHSNGQEPVVVTKLCCLLGVLLVTAQGNPEMIMMQLDTTKLR